MSETAAEVGANLRAARARAGNPSYTTIERHLIAELGPDTAPRAETIRAYHRGEGPDPATMNLELLRGVAGFYGCELADLSPTVARRLLVLLVGNRRTRDLPPGVTGRYPHPAAA